MNDAETRATIESMRPHLGEGFYTLFIGEIDASVAAEPAAAAGFDLGQEFFLDQDPRGLWYVVATEHYGPWTIWTSLENHHPDSFETPAYAHPLVRGPQALRFTAWYDQAVS